MKDNRIVYRVICECYACGKKIIVEFLVPPSEDDKLGYYCDECAANAE